MYGFTPSATTEKLDRPPPDSRSSTPNSALLWRNGRELAPGRRPGPARGPGTGRRSGSRGRRAAGAGCPAPGRRSAGIRTRSLRVVARRPESVVRVVVWPPAHRRSIGGRVGASAGAGVAASASPVRRSASGSSARRRRPSTASARVGVGLGRLGAAALEPRRPAAALGLRRLVSATAAAFSAFVGLRLGLVGLRLGGRRRLGLGRSAGVGLARRRGASTFGSAAAAAGGGPRLGASSRPPRADAERRPGLGRDLEDVDRAAGRLDLLPSPTS